MLLNSPIPITWPYEIHKIEVLITSVFSSILFFTPIHFKKLKGDKVKLGLTKENLTVLTVSKVTGSSNNKGLITGTFVVKLAC